MSFSEEDISKVQRTLFIFFLFLQLLYFFFKMKCMKGKYGKIKNGNSKDNFL